MRKPNFGTALRALTTTAVLTAMTTAVFAETSAFTIVDDPALDSAITAVRADFLASRNFNRLNATILIKQPDGTWKRGSYNGDEIQYPASCVKLAYMAAAMYYCRINNLPYTALDADVRPMITVSDNHATGRVVDAITGAPNVTNPNKPGTISFNDWYAKRLFTENFLTNRGLLDNQTILHKTYPTNSGSTPSGYEQQAQTLRGGNRMQARLSASLMLEIVYGAIEPGATSYMRELLTHNRWSGDSSIGFGLPPGSVYENKIGVAYDTAEDIAYVVLPNGTEFILSVYTNSWDQSVPYPYDAAQPGAFTDRLIEALSLDAGGPPKIILDNESTAVQVTGNWTYATAQPDKYGASYLYASGGSGATATYSFNVPETGQYEVVIWWSEGSNRASNAPFTINHAGGASTVTVDQRRRGGMWVKLGDYNFTQGSGSVTIGTSGVSTSSLVVADAIKATKYPSTGGGGTEPPAPGTDVVVDNEVGSPFYTETGSWTTSTSAGYNDGGYRFSSLTAGNTANWMAELTQDGLYNVQVFYRAGTNRATATKYDVATMNGVASTTINQQVNDRVWVSLGQYPFAAGSNVLSLDAGGSTGGSVVIADAARFTRVGPLPSPATTISVSDIVPSTVNAGGGNKRGRVVVTIRDNQGNPVANATVSGAFSGSYNENASGVTGSNGTVTLTTTGAVKGTVSFQFCVSNVTHATLTYDALANLETCDGI